MSSTKYKLGADPETFIKLGDKFISAAGILPGSKTEPFKVEGGAVQVDGLAFEYNIDPAETAIEFCRNHHVVVAQMDEMVKKIDKDMKIVFVPFATFEPKYFEKLPLENKILGCDPDFNCLTGAVIEKKEDITERPFRTAAGHAHIGWTEGEEPMNAVHFQDAQFVANFFYKKEARHKLLGRTYYTSDELSRLNYYGMCGAFRPKSYGVELREFSNLWAANLAGREKMFNFIKTEMETLG